MLANTTVAEITNDIEGEDDQLVPTDPTPDQIRRIRVKNI